MSELPPSHEHETPSSSKARRFADSVMRRLNISPARELSSRPEATSEQLELLHQNHGDVVIGSEKAEQLIDAVNHAPGRLSATDFVPPRSLDGNTEEIAKLIIDPRIDLEGEAALDDTYWTTLLATDKFVSAPDFADWQHGRGKGYEKHGESSRRRIKRYASMPTETAQPIKGVTVFVQENDETYFVITKDGAHRVAAAKQRGDEFVRASDIRLVRVPDNRISEQLNPSTR